MYWFKLKFSPAALIALIYLAAFSSCKPDIKETGAKVKFFDIKGYFERDSTRLTKLNQPVFKTVTHDTVNESKKVHIANWGTELSLFKESDINRPAWRDSYTIQGDSDLLIYTAKDPELKTRKILIKQVKGKVKWILIYNHTKNILYQTSEKLSYFPDSLYLIEKSQSVRLLGTNRYRIKGIFNSDGR